MSVRAKFDAGTTGVSDMSASTQNVIVAGWYSVDSGKRDGVIERFKDMVVRARSKAGCLDMAITADPVDSNRINIFEFWRSEKDFNS
jgi:quinol monooxygenase YgiN